MNAMLQRVNLPEECWLLHDFATAYQRLPSTPSINTWRAYLMQACFLTISFVDTLRPLFSRSQQTLLT